VHRGQVDARPCVDEKSALGRKTDFVCAVAFGEDGKAAAVKINPGIMDIIGILTGANAAGTEPDLPPVFVGSLHSAHHSVFPVIWFFTMSRLRSIR